MPFVKVASLAALPPGTLMEAAVGEDRYAICNVDGEVYALDGFCPHAGGPLGHGALHGDTLVCPWHSWEYNCRTGVCLHADVVKVETLRVKILDGDVLVEVL